MSNCSDPDKDRHSVGPDLGPNCLQMLSVDNKTPLARKPKLVSLDYGRKFLNCFLFAIKNKLTKKRNDTY